MAPEIFGLHWVSFEQWGNIIPTDFHTTVTFPISFSKLPVVIPFSNTLYTSGTYASVPVETATSLTGAAYTNVPNYKPSSFYWMAIGS